MHYRLIMNSSQLLLIVMRVHVSDASSILVLDFVDPAKSSFEILAPIALVDVAISIDGTRERTYASG